MTDALLSATNLRIAHRHTDEEAVHGVTFALKPGDRLGIVGESGSGKTLTCRSLVGILPPVFVVSGGRVELDGQDIASFSERDWRTARGRTITAVFQDPGSYFTPSIRIGAHLVLRGVSAAARHEREPSRFWSACTYGIRTASIAASRTNSPVACCNERSSPVRWRSSRGYSSPTR
jgi:ABC-type glutathione transport system ATPase component